MLNEHNDSTGREQKTTQLIDAPVSKVWEAFTKPEHIKHWWGPNGFTNTIDIMQVKNGGEWIFTMHGPDGSNYPNKTIFREVVPFTKLVHEHFEPNFLAFISFQSEGNQTLLHWNKLYETKELYDLVEIQYQTNEGFKQTIQRLQDYVSGLSV